MISSERFNEIANKVRRREFISPLDAEELITSLAELDANLLVAQNTVDFVLAGAIYQIEQLGKEATEIMGTRDHAKVKKLASRFGGAAGKLTMATQTFVQGQVRQAQEMLDSAAGGGDGEFTDDETTAGPVGADDE